MTTSLGDLVSLPIISSRCSMIRRRRSRVTRRFSWALSAFSSMSASKRLSGTSAGTVPGRPSVMTVRGRCSGATLLGERTDRLGVALGRWLRQAADGGEPGRSTGGTTSRLREGGLRYAHSSPEKLESLARLRVRGGGSTDVLRLRDALACIAGPRVGSLRVEGRCVARV